VSRRLFIVGAGGFGRELEGHLERVPAEQRKWEIAGFLDDDPAVLDGYPSSYGVVGPVKGFEFRTDDLAILAVAKPATKKAIFESLLPKVELFTFVAPDANIGKFVRIGRGCIIGPRVIIGPNVTIGDGVFVNSASMIGHDVTIGSYASFMANNNIAGNCKIGAQVYAASSVTVIPDRVVCDGAYIGAGSIVIQDIKERRTVFGNPAKYV
jgi:sugar O-acyltransferase (sialic acid O-acetyltransferase NeuD family)